MPPGARLPGAPALQALREPTPRLDVTPRHVLRPAARPSRRERLGGALRAGAGALAVNAALACGLVLLLAFREPGATRTVEIPVEVVAEAPKPAAPPAAAPPAENAERLRRALAAPAAGGPAPDPNPPGPPAPPVDPPAGEARAPALRAPPPEPTRAAARERQDRPPDPAPADEGVARATHEAEPPPAPKVLATAEPGAAFAVPAPAPPPPRHAEAPPAPQAREPSATEKLAAALPMDTAAMPATFRAVLSGNGAQVNAAYKGLVFGRFNRHPEVGERARREGLRGQVVVGFTIDDAGAIVRIEVVQSSGDPRVDAIGLELVRASAPFPPPPADAQRSFTPALAFGP